MATLSLITIFDKILNVSRNLVDFVENWPPQEMLLFFSHPSHDKLSVIGHGRSRALQNGELSLVDHWADLLIDKNHMTRSSYFSFLRF